MPNQTPQTGNDENLNPPDQNDLDDLEQDPARNQRTARINSTNFNPGNAQQQNNNANNGCICYRDMLGMFSIINDSVTKILDVLKAEHLLDKQRVQEFKRNQEEKERREKERELESTSRKTSNAIKRAIAPLKSLFDKIFGFILYTIAGGVVNKVLKWFADPANEKKVKSLTRFLKDWWPAILGAFVLFGTKFGAAIRATVKTAVSTVLYLKRIGIPGILSGLKNLARKGAITALIAGGAVLGGVALNKVLNPEEKKDDQSKNQPPKIGPQASRGNGTALAASTGGIIPKFNFFTPTSRHVSEIAFNEGGAIDDDSGIRITGAGPDTQLIAAQPGEIVMSKAAVDKFGPDTFLRMNLAAGSTNNPKFVGNIQLAKEGGMVGGLMKGLSSFGSSVMKKFNMPTLNAPTKPKVSSPPPNAPKISASDYNTLLAIAAAEDSDPQGRADVAQSIYNRLYASKKFNMNFMTTGGRNTIKDIITGEKQYEPTFENRSAWLKITDRKSAAAALAEAKKLDINVALKMLDETDAALRNPKLQRKAQEHVGGRHSFFGVSQHGNMKGDDVLRYDMIKGKKVPRKDNFFTHYPAIDSDYHKTRGNTAAPIPAIFYSPVNNQQSTIPSEKAKISQMAPTIQAPKPITRTTSSIVELPPIDMRTAQKIMPQPAHPDVPDFPVIPKHTDRYGEKGTLAVLGISV